MFTKRLFKIKLHTRRVLILKHGLPVFAFLFASLMLAWPSLIAPPKEQFSLATPKYDGGQGAGVDMEKVRFYSQDSKKQPLTVVATKVLETDPEKQIITMYKPVATYQMENGISLTGQTPYGLFYQKEDYMLFEDKVTVTTDSGYEAVSRSVVCNNKTGEIYSDEKITIKGPAGHLQATGFKMTDSGEQIIFNNKTDTTIIQNNENIRIQTENGLEIKQSNQTITGQKNVIVKQTDKTITSDKMVLHYLTKEQNPNSRIDKIEAFGNVTAYTTEHKITGNKGVYNPQTGEIVMSENVVLYQGKNHISGETATLNLNTGVSKITPKKQGQSGGRVKGTLIPSELKGK